MIEIPVDAMELERVFTQVLHQQIHTLAITAPEPSSGVTTLAYGIARRCIAHDEKVLLVDFNLMHPDLTDFFKLNCEQQDSFVSLIANNIYSTTVEGLYVSPAPVQSPYILDFRDSEHLNSCFRYWLNRFDRIIIDCSAVNANQLHMIPAENICAASDGCLLMLLAGVTVESRLEEAMNKLNQANVNLLGTVINDQFNPHLVDEICRSSHHLDTYAYTWMKKFRAMIRKAAIFDVEL